MAEAPRREEVGGEEREGGDVPEVRGQGFVARGEVGEGGAGVYCGGEGEERGEGDGG